MLQPYNVSELVETLRYVDASLGESSILENGRFFLRPSAGAGVAKLDFLQVGCVTLATAFLGKLLSARSDTPGDNGLPYTTRFDRLYNCEFFAAANLFEK